MPAFFSPMPSRQSSTCIPSCARRTATITASIFCACTISRPHTTGTDKKRPRRASPLLRQLAALSLGLSGSRKGRQVPRLILDPGEHSRKDDKRGHNGGNDHCVYGWHDTLLVVSSCRREESRALTWINKARRGFPDERLQAIPLALASQ